MEQFKFLPLLIHVFSVLIVSTTYPAYSYSESINAEARLGDTKKVHIDLDQFKRVLFQQGRYEAAGLGVFYISKRRAYFRTAPRSKKRILIPEKRYIRFRASSELEELINRR